ncbi:MAG: hypothetical protein PHX34_05180 [Candidatus Shapirobacteria bacterium]|nr:hypothetical protein [Candidatus Shapirobacteria bacterium]
MSGLAVAGFGWVLLNLTFILDYLFQRSILFLFGRLMPLDWWYKNTFWFPSVMHFLFVVLIALISYKVFKSKLKVIFKAIYMVVPVAVVLVTFGIFFYQLPIIIYGLSILSVLSVLFWFFKTKQPWIYYFSVILISVVLLISTLVGMEI